MRSQDQREDVGAGVGGYPTGAKDGAIECSPAVLPRGLGLQLNQVPIPDNCASLGAIVPVDHIPGEGG